MLATLRKLYVDLLSWVTEVLTFLSGLLRGHPCTQCECVCYDDSETFRKLELLSRDMTYAARVLDEQTVGKPLHCDVCTHAREMHGTLKRRYIDPECMPNGGVVLIEMKQRERIRRRASRFKKRANADSPNIDKTSQPCEEPKIATIDVKTGNGALVDVGSVILCHYEARFESDMHLFETSKHGSPMQVQIGQRSIVPGLDDGLKGMKVGGIRKVNVPPALAYGKKSIEGRTGESIQFQVELVALLS